MQIIPGIDDRGYLEHQAEGGTTIKQEFFPHDVQPVCAECPKGGVVFMTKFIPHMGMDNLSDTIRWSLDLRYQPTGQPTGRPFWPDFVVRSKTNPAAIQDDFDAWCRRWDEALVNAKGIAWHRTVPKDRRMPADRAGV